MITAEVIAIGDELTSGGRLDTNSQWLAQQLMALGVPVGYHTTVGDEQPAIVSILTAACQRSDMVVISGGLGPTADDLTRQALAAMTGRPLVQDDRMLEHIRRLFARRGRSMPEQNMIQAQFPAGSQPLANPYGTAPGIRMSVARDSAGVAELFALPGVPAEMKDMWKTLVAPAILDKLGPDRRVIAQRQLRCFGAGESEIESRLPGLVQRGRDPTVGITASGATISLRVTAIGATDGECQAKIQPTVRTIRECLGSLVFGEGDEELQDAVGCLLGELGRTLATVEWGTAGQIAQALGEVPGMAVYFRGGVVVRDLRALGRLLGIEVTALPREALDMAALVARMAVAICDRCESDYGLAVGPFPQIDPHAATPAVIHLAAARRGQVVCGEPFVFATHPAIVRGRCAKQALNLLRLSILDGRLEGRN